MEQTSLLIGTPGSVGEREVQGGRYFYRQYYDAKGKKAADYIGSVADPKAVARARAIADQIVFSNALLRDAKTLARLGYVRADVRTSAVLAALANHGFFRGGGVLVGSHAYGALLNELGARAAAFTTEDVDVARGALKIAIAQPAEFAKMLADSSLTLLPVPSLDRKKPSTSYSPPGADRFRVDLLVPTARRQVTVHEVPELKAHATALPFLGYLLEDPMDTIVVGREAIVPVRVPCPERFAWHKALVSQLRNRTDKRDKDLRQAASLFAVLSEDSPESVEEAFAKLPSRARAPAKRGARQALAILRTGPHPRAEDLVSELL
jgi:hypothetical protein